MKESEKAMRIYAKIIMEEFDELVRFMEEYKVDYKVAIPSAKSVRDMCDYDTVVVFHDLRKAILINSDTITHIIMLLLENLVLTSNVEVRSKSLEINAKLEGVL